MKYIGVAWGTALILCGFLFYSLVRSSQMTEQMQNKIDAQSGAIYSKNQELQNQINLLEKRVKTDEQKLKEIEEKFLSQQKNAKAATGNLSE